MSPVYVIGTLRVDRDRRQVDIDGRPINLRKIEFDLLATLASHPERVFPCEELLRDVWGFQSPRGVDTGRIRRAVRDIRRELGAEWIVVERGVGYRLVQIGQVAA